MPINFPDSGINKLVDELTYFAVQPLMDDNVWRYYAYKKRPKHGSLRKKLFPKSFELENFIIKQLLIMGVIDIICGIKQSNIPNETKLSLTVGVIDRIKSVSIALISLEVFMDSLTSSFIKQTNNKKSDPYILEAQHILKKEDFARFLVGTIALFPENMDDYFLDSNIIKTRIEKSNCNGKLNVSLNNKELKKMLELIDQHII